MKQLIVCVLLASAIAFAGDHKTPLIGEHAPSFTLKNYDGKEYGLSALQKDHAYTVLIFISTQCPVSNGYNDRMESLYEKYRGKGIAVVGINANKAEDVRDIAAHAREHGFMFPVLKDEQNRVADKYDAQVTPEAFVINSTGMVVYHGRIDDNRRLEKVQSHDLADALDQLLAGKKPNVTETKAFGCSIKRLVTD